MTIAILSLSFKLNFVTVPTRQWKLEFQLTPLKQLLMFGDLQV